jgi:hypothetical protein
LNSAVVRHQAQQIEFSLQRAIGMGALQADFFWSFPRGVRMIGKWTGSRIVFEVFRASEL